MERVRKYSGSWNAEEMQINFNQKQWRQDLAAFVGKKRYWLQTRVSRSRTIEKKSNYNEAIKEFSIYDAYGGEEIVRYTNKNEIIHTTNEQLLLEYYNLKGLRKY